MTFAIVLLLVVVLFGIGFTIAGIRTGLRLLHAMSEREWNRQWLEMTDYLHHNDEYLPDLHNEDNDV